MRKLRVTCNELTSLDRLGGGAVTTVLSVTICEVMLSSETVGVGLEPAVGEGVVADLKLTVAEKDLPGPGEVAEMEEAGYAILIENVKPPSEADDGSVPAQPGEVVKFVPVDITAPTSVVRHAARVFQRNKRTRVDRWTVCDRAGGREVSRRRDAEPLTNVTCAQCRRYLVVEGLLSD